MARTRPSAAAFLSHRSHQREAAARPPPDAERSFSSSAANTFAGRRLTRNRRGLFSIVTVSPIRVGSKMSAMAMTSTVTHMSGRATCRLIVVRPGFGARPRPGKDGERW